MAFRIGPGFLLWSVPLLAQPKDAEIEIKEGKKYYVHIVQTGNSLWGIHTLYNVPVDDIIATNPGVENGIKDGQKLLIPVVGNLTSDKSKPGIKSEVKHTVQAQETLYGISKKYNVTIEQIINAASKSSGVRGAGFIENSNQRIIVNTEGQSKSLEDIGKTPVITNKNQIIYLKDLAVIKEGSVPTISAASINGEEGIYLSVQGQLGSDTYKLTQLIEAAVLDIKPSLLDQDIQINPELFRKLHSDFRCSRI